MIYRKRFSEILFPVLFFAYLFSCQNKPKPIEKDVVTVAEKMPEHLSEDIKKIVEYALQNKASIIDSAHLGYMHLDSSLYEDKKYEAIWSAKEQWLATGDSLYQFIENCRYYGLFPSDYHFGSLSFIHRVFNEDTIARKNIALWAKADLLLTDAFFSLVKDLKQGRLQYDSVTLRTDTLLRDTFFIHTLDTALLTGSISYALHNIEPKHAGYDSVKAYAKDFLAAAKFNPFTYLFYPYKDSVAFFKSLQTRLYEIGMLTSDTVHADTTILKLAIRKYQKSKNLKLTGRVDEKMVNALNDTDIERFKRIAINLDRYKLLPDSLPHTYVWVNLPAFYLKVIDSDTLVFESKVIVGKPDTRTPLLTSEVSNFITLPQWTVPNSIIFKEMLPKIKQNVDFLKKENLMVVDKDDNVVDPSLVKWARLNKNNFPYQLKQGQGDNNSLGVIKFNFRNKYSVYMHDTNVRWMFGKPFRALSHGCVRVQQWEKLSDFLIRNDTVRYHPDSLRAWIKRQEKHVVSGFHKVPVFFRYFTCEGKKGHLRFYDDIYGEDKFLREKYFADKAVK
jgi:murein L,D-transpeptidase YcbB/YkuD